MVTWAQIGWIAIGFLAVAGLAGIVIFALRIGAAMFTDKVD